MVVTKIEYQKRDPTRVNIYTDNVFFCGISLDTLASENIYEGVEVLEENLNHILVKELKSRFLTRVNEYLSHSPKTEIQVYRYLKNLKFKKKDIWFKSDVYLDWDIFFEDIVHTLKKYKYIDDESYARMFVLSRLRNRPRGKSVIISELISKGVSKEIALRVCEEEIVDEYEILREAFEKKFRGREFNINDQRMVGYLLRKGFSWDLIEQFSKNDT